VKSLTIDLHVELGTPICILTLHSLSWYSDLKFNSHITTQDGANDLTLTKI
jgi:hypothetical protein